MTGTNPHEFACPDPIEAVVRLGGGVVTVTAHDATTATVDVTPYDESDASRSAAANTRVELRDGRLSVEAPEQSGGWMRRGGRVRVRVVLPTNSTVAAKAGSADVRLDGRLGAANVRTGSGDTTVETIAGDLAVKSGSGDLAVVQVGGALLFQTGSGDVKGRSIGGPVSVETSSGDVLIDAAAAAVQIRTASGDVRLGSVRGDKVKVLTASGDVSVGVPAGTAVWLDLNTVSGSTRSDLAMSGEAPVDGAQLNLSVQTVSGDIDVHRVLAPAV